MCYAIPGKVIGFEGNRVVVDYFGERRKAINEMHGVKVGDYVYAQGGFVVEKISEAKAKPILEDWKEMFFELKKIDSRLSQIRVGEVDKEFRDIIEKARAGESLKREEGLRLLETKDRVETELLFETANHIRQERLDNACCVHGIIEFSNYCRNREPEEKTPYVVTG